MLQKFLLTFGAVFAFASAAVACPDFNIAPQASYEASGKQLYTTRGFDVVAGGSYCI